MRRLLGRPNEVMLAITQDTEFLRPSKKVGAETGMEGKVLLTKRNAQALGLIGSEFEAIADGNRSALLTRPEVKLWGRLFAVGVKGIGAKGPLYSEWPKAGEPHDGRSFTSESWFGESPWGAMSKKACMEDMEISALAGRDGINGFMVCPVLWAARLPVPSALGNYWYRRHVPEGSYQELRLMPSDVRLFYQSETTLGQRAGEVMAAFDVDTQEALDSFLDRYIRSGMSALTLLARAMRRVGGSTQGLVFVDVWLDKDSVIAPDGTLFFADLEGLDWADLPDEGTWARLLLRQFNRNLYEFMFGLDSLQREAEKRLKKAPSQGERRRIVGKRIALAMEGDPVVSVQESGAGLDISISPIDMSCGFEIVRIRLIDYQEGT